ncbi:NADAR family protein [Pleionea sediminis]|uniref:NADAR family protein n=1 Tax=Pleionea sediminis TaxID=2569479 RepID=UPI00197B8710|nr:NADAR family protein [Pleionea sediminis]
MNIRTVQSLVDYVNRGNKVKYLYFWGHQKNGAKVSGSCFSQWYESSFMDDNYTYQTAEHFMMAEKAKLFGDIETQQKIIAASNPGAAKALGRQVIGFDEALWVENRFNIVVKGNLLKFGQNKELLEFLLNTKERVLVEASPVDKIWGVGLAADNSKVGNPNLWKGLNLLGFALMEVREQLKAANPT